MHRIVALGVPYGERKNRKRRFFLSKSMPNFNFAKVQLESGVSAWKEKNS
jgi:hypothetical protein